MWPTPFSVRVDPTWSSRLKERCRRAVSQNPRSLLLSATLDTRIRHNITPYPMSQPITGPEMFAEVVRGLICVVVV